MRFFLSPELQAQRRGRFLATLIGTEPLAGEGLPNNGFLLVIGEHFQSLGSQQQDYLSWARQPGCALLLLPPYQEGRIATGLDWAVRYSTGQPLAPEQGSIAALLAAEVIYRMEGGDGASEEDVHLWTDHSSHTRYWKAHSNSGLVAATTLPLWSISLINEEAMVCTWLECLAQQTGRLSAPVAATEDDALPPLSPHDITVIVCSYGLNIATPRALSEALGRIPIPIINLAGFDLSASFERLSRRGFINASGLTAEGLDFLQTSQYWAYAEHLKQWRE